MSVLDQKVTANYAAYNGDSVEVLEGIPSESIHLSVYSPPFAHLGGGLYQYSSSPQDLSNCRDYNEFFTHYDFIVRQLFRVTLPGRISAVHCCDTPTGNSGIDNLMDFPGDIIELHTKCRKDDCKDEEWRRRKGICGHGWFKYIARYSVWKEPLGVRNRTMAKNLAHKTIVEDSSRCSVASADYLLVFRRKGENKVAIAHPTGLMNYAGERAMPAELLRYRGWTGNQIENRFSHWIWRQYASAFWDDVRIARVLPYKKARDQEDEKHIHPLQLDVIERACILWSNPGEVVLTPFAGVGSEVYGALINGRKAIGIELKPTYYRQMLLNIEFAKEGGDNSQASLELEYSDLPLDEALTLD